VTRAHSNKGGGVAPTRSSSRFRAASAKPSASWRSTHGPRAVSKAHRRKSRARTYLYRGAAGPLTSRLSARSLARAAATCSSIMRFFEPPLTERVEFVGKNGV